MTDDSGMAGKTQEELDRDDEVAAARARRGAGADDQGGQSVEDIEANGGVDDDDEPQLPFDIPEPSRKINLGTLIPKNTPTKVKYKMSGKSIPAAQGGVMDPDETTGLLLVSYVVEDVDVAFTRDSARKITEATVYVTISPREVVNARSEAGRVLMGEAAAA